MLHIHSGLQTPENAVHPGLKREVDGVYSGLWRKGNNPFRVLALGYIVTVGYRVRGAVSYKGQIIDLLYI